MPTETRTVQPVTEYAPGSPGRLARARRKAWERVATIARNHGDNARRVIDSMNADDWRQAARGRFNATTARQSGRWAETGGAFYADSFDVLAWRDLGTAEEVSRREGSRAVDHSGWYCDHYASETVAGRVLQLPARGGLARYVAGIQWSHCDGVTLWPLETYATPLEAARAADSAAETMAEQEREYSTAWHAGQVFAELAETVAELRREALAILAERRAVRGIEAPNLCRAIRDRLESILDDIRDARAKRRDLREGDADGFCFWSGDARLVEAFNDGAGVP